MSNLAVNPFSVTKASDFSIEQIDTLWVDLADRRGMTELTYLELDTDEVLLFREETSRGEVIDFLNETVEEWFAWLIPHVDWIAKRNDSAEKAPFPFTTFRAGQRELARSVYRAVQNKLNLFMEAPTGMGKTLATLYPAIKALPLIADGKVFYVTAKTPGRLARRTRCKGCATSACRYAVSA